MSEASAKLRVDKWLWYARVAKSRTLAAKIVVAGHVRLNKDKLTSASQAVKVGDVLTIARNDQIRILKIVALGERRGPASEAQQLYEDLSPPVERKAKPVPVEQREAGAGRPTKRDRRQTMRLKQTNWDE